MIAVYRANIWQNEIRVAYFEGETKRFFVRKSGTKIRKISDCAFYSTNAEEVRDWLVAQKLKAIIKKERKIMKHKDSILRMEKELSWIKETYSFRKNLQRIENDE